MKGKDLDNKCTIGLFVRGRGFVPEYKFMPGRKFAFDWALPSQQIAVEYEGGVHNMRRIKTRKGETMLVSGWHQHWKTYEKDRFKYNWAQVNGWIVLSATAATDLTVFFDLIDQAITNRS